MKIIIKIKLIIKIFTISIMIRIRKSKTQILLRSKKDLTRIALDINTERIIKL